MGNGRESQRRTDVDLWVLRLTREPPDGVIVLTAHGRVGVVAAPRLLAACEKILAEGHRRLVLDLGDVDYINSSGLTALEEIAAQFTKAGGAFAICAPVNAVRFALDLAGLLSALPIESSRAAALERLRPP